MDEGKGTAASNRSGRFCGWLGWWIRWVGDEIKVRAGVDLSSEGIGDGKVGLLIGFWVLVFPTSGILVCLGLVKIYGRSVEVRRGWGDGGPPALLMVCLWWWSDDGYSDAAMVRGVLLGFWAWLVGLCLLFHGLAENWAWIMSVDIYLYVHVLSYFYFLVVGGFRPLISRYHFMVGLGGLCSGLRTLCAWFALVRWCALIKWSQPPSGRMKHRAQLCFSALVPQL